MARNRFYGIKFPFTVKNEDGFFVDVNKDEDGRVASEILHVLLTPKRTRIHRPDFGTNFAQYIFEQNDELTWEQIRDEAVNSIGRYVANVTLTNIEVIRDEDNDSGMYLVLNYKVANGKAYSDKQIGVKLV